MDKFGHTQEKLSVALGKSRPYIANSLRLLSLPKRFGFCPNRAVKRGTCSAADKT